MAETILTYFDFKGRAETARMILTYYGHEFIDRRVSREEWGELKTTGLADFGQIPVL